MNKKLTPRYIIVGVILAWALYALWPTLRYETMSDDQKETLREAGELKAIESKTIKQGLDLKGGMHIVLEADLPTLINNLAVNKDRKFETVVDKVREAIQDPETEFFTLFRMEAEAADLRLPRYYPDYGANPADIIDGLEEEATDALNRVLEILSNRVDQFGVSEPTIQKQGNRRIIVELAGIQDPERARELLQSTALLEFVLVKNPEVTQDFLVRIDKILKGSEELEEIVEATGDTAAASAPVDEFVSEDKTISVNELFGEAETAATDAETGSSVVVDDRLFAERPFSSLLRNLGGDIGVPEKNYYAVKKILEMPEVRDRLAVTNSQFLFNDSPETYTSADGVEEKFYRLYQLESESEITGGVIEEARATIGSQGSENAGQNIVLLDMNSEGQRTWARVTGANIGKRVAIVLDHKVRMAPVIEDRIAGGSTLIRGFANMNEAKDIAIVLRAGALPAPVNIIEERIVGPSLGADSIRKGTLSVIIGLIVVLIFMLFYYKTAGFIADFALIWNVILILSVLASLGAALTLPGIAGLILTVGMSIDANVIIFERIREELRKGKTPRAAIDAGYARALTTIIDANVTTVIAALVLYQFGTGPIRGFATVLFWGIVISMFTAIFVTRTIFNTITSRKQLQTLSI
ncbi:MAG: protein translocase subunit SecD [Candidatus Neomarinimicrobiota bacterium]